MSTRFQAHLSALIHWLRRNKGAAWLATTKEWDPQAGTRNPRTGSKPPSFALAPFPGPLPAIYGSFLLLMHDHLFVFLVIH